MLCLKGIDNAYYYRLVKDDPRHYLDYTGTGNSLNMPNPHVLQLIMDSLRYWILEMHVDGFRFDLAATLARELHDVQRLSAFFDIMQQDPVISQVKLIAEPWDLGEGGYQVGNFPPGWSEWNGKYRDCLRDFWRGQDRVLSEFAYRLTGSSDLYADNSRNPFAASTSSRRTTASAARPGLLQRKAQPGQRRGQPRRHRRQPLVELRGRRAHRRSRGARPARPGSSAISWRPSCSPRGSPCWSPATSAGAPSSGNNNAYCQDNEVSWLDWANPDRELLAFCRRLITFRRVHPAFRRRGWFRGRAIHGADIKDIAWFTHTGRQMKDEQWGVGFAKSLGVFINGETIPNPNARSEPVTDASFFMIFNAHFEPLGFTLPTRFWGRSWIRLLDTATGWIDGAPALPARARIKVAPHSTVLLMRQD